MCYKHGSLILLLGIVNQVAKIRERGDFVFFSVSTFRVPLAIFVMGLL